MKTILTITLAATLLACSSPKQESAEATAETVAVEQKADLSASVDAYMTLKDAFVATDAAKAKDAAATLSTELKKAGFESLVASSDKIAGSEDIKVQRAAFYELTTAFIPEVKKAELTSKVYVQYCPMAFDNTGANWLSTSSEIRNPYFGDMMLKCGKVEEEI
ncbi:MAG: hypothetical protein CMB80_32700 [Flammeovirgaceae bacterium]|nr:hypothetical protein [Flammeovirgaceae bacterium]HCX25096.1 hypothetical protein [Cytophagales bacterium]|tara:strand:+ start:388 stop:876 length:489 start_codon:yes stop_codon:yes gene_type:complete